MRKRQLGKNINQIPVKKDFEAIGNKLQGHVAKLAKRVEEKDDLKLKEIASAILENGTLIEMLYERNKNETSLAIYKNEKIEIKKFIASNGVTLKPHKAEKDLLKNSVVLFPSKPEEYESQDKLITEIQFFIHKYLAVSIFFEKIASYYVLFSWIHDDFNELPYLRGLGDYGTGKSRFLQVVGSICYRPIFTGGATTISPIFRILEEFGGTLILDEADFKMSDTTADIVKILNSGFMKNMPVLRSEANNKKSYDTKSFNVFGPKIIATRQLYEDSALESRMITEDMSLISRRDDIPYNIPDSFRDEALGLRNKLLMFRFREKGKYQLNPKLGNPNIEPRLNQISLPLMSIISDSAVLEEIKKYLEEYNEKLKNDRTLSYQYQILDAVCKLIDEGNQQPTMQEISDEFNKGLSPNEQKSAKKMGFLIRKVTNLKTERNYKGFILSLENKDKIQKLRKRLGIPDSIYDIAKAEHNEHYEP